MKQRRKVEKTTPPLSTRQRWLFRFALLFLAPLLLLGVIEGILRLAGYGYSTELLQKVEIAGRPYLVNNENFGLRFFPPELARWPGPVKIEAVKPKDTFRIFIFGESAAQGDPEPSYRAGRYLEVLLRERYPGVKFEVVNVAITAINSHVIVPIARECAGYQGDLWIVYMGNNEMIGPFGAASVFGWQAPPWPMVRLSLALQELRLGQLLKNIGRGLKRPGHSPAVWGGMEMFLGNQLAPGDPRKEVVYKNFERNLWDILQAGRKSGADILLNTVAVNLKDCPPFASVSSSRLSAAQKETFARLESSGRAAAAQADWRLAADYFGQAIELDPTMAQAHFEQAECLRQLHDSSNALAQYELARDDDALPFRTDGRLNGIIRHTAARCAGPDFILCDTPAALAPPGSILGDETFYEHVHFNFDGNYRLARLWAERAESMLPESVKNAARDEWASQQTCEARLGLTDWNRVDVYNAVRERMQRPPLDSQPNNARRLAALTAEIERLSAHKTGEAAQARALYEDALRHAPADYILHGNYGEFLELTGDYRHAAEEWKQAHELAPRNPFAFLTEGKLRARLGETNEAGACFRQALALHPRYAEAWRELGKLAVTGGDVPAAMEDYRRALALQPNDAQTYVQFGKALALRQRPEESIQNFRRAIELNPANWEAHYALGGELGAVGRVTEARDEFARAVQLQPDFAMAHLNYGVALLKLNDPAGARREFGETLRLDPSNRSARSYLSLVNP